MNINSTGTKADLSLIGKTGSEKKKKKKNSYQLIIAVAIQIIFISIIIFHTSE